MYVQNVLNENGKVLFCREIMVHYKVHVKLMAFLSLADTIPKMWLKVYNKHLTSSMMAINLIINNLE